jgi:predicted RND superfamily exporter protein
LIKNRFVSFSSSFFLRCLILAGIMGLGFWSLLTLRFQTELLPLFPQELPSVKMLEKAQASIASEREVIVLAQPNPGWSVMQKLAEGLRGKPGIGDVRIDLGSTQSPSQWMASLIAGLPEDRFFTMQQSLTPVAIKSRLDHTLQQMSGALDETEMGRLRFDPLRLQEIVFAGSNSSQSIDVARLPPVLAIDADRSLKTFEDDQKFVAQVRNLLAAQASEISPTTQFMLTGQPAIIADVSSHMKRDLLVMLSFTIALTSLAFWITYRSLMPLIWIIAAQVLALFCALTAARVTFGQINVLSIGFSSILLGVGMDYCILVYHFFAQPGEPDPDEWRKLRHAIWLSSVTTAATFGVLYFSSFPGLRQLAVLVGVGLIATAYFAVTLLAGLLARRRPQAPRCLGTVSQRCAQFLFRQRVILCVAAGAVLIAAIAMAPKLATYPFYDSSIDQLEPTQLESSRAQKILQTHFSPPLLKSGDAEKNRADWQPIDLHEVAVEFQAAGLDASWSGPTLQILDSLNRWHAGSLNLTGAGQAETAWISLRHDLNLTAVHDFKRLSLVMIAIVFVLCCLTHRSVRLVTLNLVTLFFALLLLAGMLYVTGNSMTIVSLLCIPLMIGLVIDYSLHILLALEHAGGELVGAFRHIAVPVFLTGLASIIGFTAPMLSSQPALQNFGNVMDLGIVAAVTSGLILLPAFYSMTWRNSILTPHHSVTLYRASIFTLAAFAARYTPLKLTRSIAGLAGILYALTHPEKVAVVHRNLLLLDQNLKLRNARKVYREFGQTIADYFYIGSRPRGKAAKIIRENQGKNYLRAAYQQGKGGIIITAHFGLFELGGLFTAEQRIPVTVLTFPEPSHALTQWRAQFRRKWGVDTITIGTDPFAFLPIADRLREGHFIAALIDRPHSSESVPVRFPYGMTLFSSGILLLAAHSGAPVLPATMVRHADGHYQAHIFPPIEIKSRGSRTETLQFYSQQIADILIPTLCDYPEQWYQFTPLSPS